MLVNAVEPGWTSPLREIERAAQERAKGADIDMSAPDGRDRLRALLVEEVQEWRAQFRRGQRLQDIADPDGAVERGLRNLTGYGPLQPLLEDPDVWEIMVNGPASIFCKRHSGPSGYHHEVFHDDDHVVRVLTKVLDDASRSHRKLDPAEGLQDAQLDNGARLHIVHADVGRDGHMLVNIRKFSGLAHRHLSELTARGMLDVPTSRFLTACVRSGLSVLVAGAPGSGKTTMLGCLAAELDPSLRVVVAEEVFETDIPLPNVDKTYARLVEFVPWLSHTLNIELPRPLLRSTAESAKTAPARVSASADRKPTVDNGQSGTDGPSPRCTWTTTSRPTAASGGRRTGGFCRRSRATSVTG
jgi:pilus assembly protein CpaF